MRRPGRRAPMLMAIGLLAGCGSFQPFATPFVPRPALPSGVEFPNLTAEEAVDRLEVLGFACGFEPDSDIPGGWSCMRGNQEEGEWMQVSIDSDETGPVSGAFGHLQSTGHTKEEFDQIAAATFQEVMLAVFVPEDVHPSGEDLVQLVGANWPVELGSRWLLGFDRSSENRRIRVVFSEEGLQAAP